MKEQLKIILSIGVAIFLVWLSPLAFYGARAALILIFCVAISFFFIVDKNLDHHPVKADKIDPQKWALDANTGEFIRIYFSHKEGQRYDYRSYQQRLDYRLAILSTMDERNTFRVISLIVAICLHLLSYSTSQNDFFLHYGSLVAGWIGTYCFIVACYSHAENLDVLDRPENEVGPQPVFAVDPANIQNRKTYGDDRPDHLDDLDRAARGDAPRATRKPIFDD